MSFPLPELMHVPVVAHLVRIVGLVLINTLWQGAVIGLGLVLALIALRDRGPRARYAACVTAMAALLLIPAITGAVLLMRPTGPWQDTILLPVFRVVTIETQAVQDAWFVWISTAWIAGTLLLQVRLMRNWLYVQRLKRETLPLATRGAPVMV